MITPIQERPSGVEPTDGSGHTRADQLWMTVTEANRSGSARQIADAEDAVFRHYLPWARSMAATASPTAASPNDTTTADHCEYQDAAEVGLAQAILAWRRTDTGRFMDFARRLIIRRIQRIPAGVNHRRLGGSTISGPAEVSSFDVPGRIEKDRATAAPAAGVEVALLDREGTIVWVNDEWKAFGEANGGVPGRTAVGMSYLAICDAAQGDPYAELVARAIRRAADGTCERAVTIRIPCGAPNRDCWYDVLIVPRTDEELEPVGVAVALSSVAATIWDTHPQAAAAW